MIKKKLIYKLNPGEAVDDYDCNVNPAPFNEYANAALRFGHSQAQGVLKYANYLNFFGNII